MKRIIFLFWTLCFSKLVFAQLSSVPVPKHLILFEGRSDPIMWPELGYMYLGKKYHSFQIKASFYKDFSEATKMNSNYYSINHYNGSAVFNSNFYYVKPGYVLYKNTHPTRNFFILVNGLISYSENKLLLTVIDPLLGVVTQESNDNQFYQAMELEMKWHLDLNKHLAFSVGGFVGFNFNEPILFEEEYNGAFKGKESYKPGIGYFNKVYYMISLGLVVKPY